jgi:hypothetical protein
MRVSDFDHISDFETEGLLSGSRERNWIWLGLIVSLAIHFALCAYFYRTRFQAAEMRRSRHASRHIGAQARHFWR